MRSCCPKYRIYDKQDNAMYAVTSIVWAEDGANIRSVGANGRTYEFTEGAEGGGSWPLMQATGIRDRHGNEIYVGDLMKWDEREWGDPYNETVDADYDTWRKSDWPEFCEIVGNIYQNPELVDK